MRGSVALVLLALLGCEAEPPETPPSSAADGLPTRASEPGRAALPTDTSWRPGPARKTTHFDPDRLALERECRSCHVDANASWQHSQHASAWSSRAFQRAFASEPQPFCQRCHAPETGSGSAA